MLWIHLKIHKLASFELEAVHFDWFLVFFIFSRCCKERKFKFWQQNRYGDGIRVFVLGGIPGFVPDVQKLSQGMFQSPQVLI